MGFDDNEGWLLAKLSFGWVFGAGLAVILLSAAVWLARPEQMRLEYQQNMNSQQNIVAANERISQLYTEYLRLQREIGQFKAQGLETQVRDDEALQHAIINQMGQEISTLPNGVDDVRDIHIRQLWNSQAAL